MEKFNKRMYNYEVDPPRDVWKSIARKLDEEDTKVIPIRKNRLLYYGLAAASVAIILFCIVFFNRSNSDQQIVSSNPANPWEIQKNPLSDRDRSGKKQRNPQGRSSYS